MKKQLTTGDSYPTATIAINKGRVKIYNKEATMPTYYLKKGEEFQIELFNPTKITVMAKIKLNNNLISQAGLVLKPGQRIFLDRYFDIDKKFKFDTYMVSGSSEVKKAIEDNGDIEILFYNEIQKINFRSFVGYATTPSWSTLNNNTGSPYNGDFSTTSINSDAANYSVEVGDILNMDCCMDTSNEITRSSVRTSSITRRNAKRFKNTLGGEKKLKSKRVKVKTDRIETGRIEEGSKSNQTFDSVSMDFDYSPFHTVSYKLLPLSQKNIEVEDLHKTYCTNCGAKALGKDKFCSKCGNKL
tara:strand:- start:572 stop:1471 length:900 start_codon:yes stop_codon:yes gene_type:complete